MKKLTNIFSSIILICFFSYNVISQNSIYLKEKDTLFILYENNVIENNLVKKNVKNVFLDNRPIGLMKEYILFTPQELKEKKAVEKKKLANQERIKNNNLKDYNLNTYRYDKEYGLKFINSVKHIYYDIDEIIKYSNSLKKNYINKNGIIDSIKVDKYIYEKARINDIARISIILSKYQLNEKRLFYFDGSKRKRNQLLEIIKEPIIIFILNRDYFDEKMTKTFLFDEVVFKNKIGKL